MTTVREARPADRPRLRAIQTGALVEPWPDLLSVGLDGDVPLVFVVEADVVVGYAVVVTADTVAYIAEFAIAPDRQRQGYGSTLMERLLSRLAVEEYETVTLTVRATDDGPQSFYAVHGFAIDRRVPAHYDDGTDGLVLSRSLGTDVTAE
ncbi:MAG: GNAT family N-acetyltransferase [Haloarculaceae archaeon]